MQRYNINEKEKNKNNIGKTLDHEGGYQVYQVMSNAKRWQQEFFFLQRRQLKGKKEIDTNKIQSINKIEIK